MTQLARRVLRDEFLQRRPGHQRRELRRRRDRQHLHLHERRQRPADDDAAAHSRRDDGDRAHRADGPTISASCCRCSARSAHRPEPHRLHERDHGAAARGPASRRRWPRRAARRAASTTGAAASSAVRARRDPLLHPLRRLPQRLSGVPDRSAATPTAACIRVRWARCSRRVCRASTHFTICRTRAACAARAARSARCASTFRACC